LFEEELRKLIAVAEALNRTIHVTSVTQVVQTNKTISRVFFFRNSQLIKFLISLSTALRQMESLILFSTVLIAVAYTLAWTNYIEQVLLWAEFARTNECSFFLLKSECKLFICWCNFDYDDLIKIALVFECKSCTNILFKLIARKIDPTVLFDVIFRWGRGAGLTLITINNIRCCLVEVINGILAIHLPKSESLICVILLSLSF